MIGLEILIREGGVTQALVAEHGDVADPTQPNPPLAGDGFVQVLVNGFPLGFVPQLVGQETGLKAVHPPFIAQA